MKSIFIVGPLISQHIQCWYPNFKSINCDSVNVFSLHKGGVDFNEEVNKHYYSLFGNKLDFFVFLPVFVFIWWMVRPKVTNFSYLSSYGLFSLFIPSKNLILNTWGSDVNLLYSSDNRIKKYLAKRALRRFAWINTPAEHMKLKLVALGADPNKIEVFQYGIKIEKKTGELPYHRGSVTFVSNRNWQKNYNIKNILEGFVKYKTKTRFNSSLLVYGKGNKKEERRVKSVIESLDKSITASIFFMGYVKKENMLKQMEKADIYISIPDRDGAPLSLLEAMSLGLYPIVSSIDANHEWVENGSGAFIQDTSDINQISNSMLISEELIISNERTFSKKNYDNVKNKADASINVARFHDKINEFLS